MNADYFVDTNILVYAAGGRDAEEKKRRRAVELVETLNWGSSAQVLQEFYVCVVRKITRPLPPAVALEWIQQFRVFPCADIDADLVEIAISHSLRYGISYWDGAIIAAAEQMDATTVLSEDLNSGQQYGSVRVINPFT